MEITANEVHRIDEPREHTIYMEMFGMRRSYQNNMGQIRYMLLETLLETRKSLNAQSVKVSGIYANGFTLKDAALCRALGLQPIVASAQSGDIFFSEDFSAVLRAVEYHLARAKIPLLRQTTGPQSASTSIDLR